MGENITCMILNSVLKVVNSTQGGDQTLTRLYIVTVTTLRLEFGHNMLCQHKILSYYFIESYRFFLDLWNVLRVV